MCEFKIKNPQDPTKDHLKKRLRCVDQDLYNQKPFNEPNWSPEEIEYLEKY